MHFLNFDHLNINFRFQSSFRAQNFVLFSPSPFIYLLLEVASPLSLPFPFRYHSSSKKQRNPLMKKILGLQAPMELTSREHENKGYAVCRTKKHVECRCMMMQWLMQNAMHEYDKWKMQEQYVHYNAMKRCMMQSRNMPEWVFYVPLIEESNGKDPKVPF